MKFLIKKYLYKFINPFRRIYWKVFKPKTFGVKCIIRNNEGDILLVTNSYGDQNLWNLPGGGYKPKKELPENAIRREVLEELGIKIENFRWKVPQTLHTL